MSTVSRVEVEADLSLVMTGVDGSRASAHLTGDGHRLHLELDRPEAMGAGAGRRELGRAARLIADAGLTVEVTGPSGPVATVGAGARSRLGRLLVGSDRVAMARSGHARRIVWTLVPPAVRRTVPVGGVVLLLGVLAGLRIRTGVRAQARSR